MATEFFSSPDASFTRWWLTTSDWTMVPGTSRPFQYTRIDEGIGNQNTSDYWQANSPSPAEQGAIGLQNNVPVDYVVGNNEFEFLIYFKSTKIVVDPGLRIRVYYDRVVDIPAATTGTDTNDVHYSGGGLAAATNSDLVWNVTLGEFSRVKFVFDDFHFDILPAITGQTVGDEIRVVKLQYNKNYHINTAGLWETFRLVIDSDVDLTETDLDDMEVHWVASVGTGGEIPEKIATP